MSTTSTVQLAPARSPVTAVSAIGVAISGGYASAAIDNSANLDQSCDLKVNFQGTTSHVPVAGDPLKIYFLYATDGTNYDEGQPSTNDGTTAPANVNAPDLVAVVPLVADANAHVVTIKEIPLRPYKFKVLVVNGSAVASGTVTVTITLYGDNQQIIT